MISESFVSSSITEIVKISKDIESQIELLEDSGARHYIKTHSYAIMILTECDCGWLEHLGTVFEVFKVAKFKKDDK